MDEKMQLSRVGRGSALASNAIQALQAFYSEALRDALQEASTQADALRRLAGQSDRARAFDAILALISNEQISDDEKLERIVEIVRSVQ